MKRKKVFFKSLRTIVYAIYIAVFISPILIMLNTSLKTYDDIIKWPPKWFGADLRWINYKVVIIGEKSILPALKNSIIVSIQKVGNAYNDNNTNVLRSYTGGTYIHGF